jgi:hypothetical protein
VHGRGPALPESGGARATAVLTTDSTFARVLAERTTVMPEVAPYRPSEPGVPHRHSRRTGPAGTPAPVIVTAVGMRRGDATELVRLRAGRFRRRTGCSIRARGAAIREVHYGAVAHIMPDHAGDRGAAHLGLALTITCISTMSEHALVKSGSAAPPLQ